MEPLNFSELMLLHNTLSRKIVPAPLGRSLLCLNSGGLGSIPKLDVRALSSTSSECGGMEAPTHGGHSGVMGVPFTML